MGVFFTSGRHRAPVGRSLSCHYHGGGGGGEDAAEAAARRVAERLCSRVHRPKDGATEGRRRILVNKLLFPHGKNNCYFSTVGHFVREGAPEASALHLRGEFCGRLLLSQYFESQI